MELSGGRGVLVVEDDPDTSANLRDLLEAAGYVVHERSRLADSLSFTAWNDIAVILLDRRLPDGLGEKAIGQLKQVAPDAGVIVVTGHGDLHTAVEAMRRGADDYRLNGSVCKGRSVKRVSEETLYLSCN